MLQTLCFQCFFFFCRDRSTELISTIENLQLNNKRFYAQLPHSGYRQPSGDILSFSPKSPLSLGPFLASNLIRQPSGDLSPFCQSRHKCACLSKCFFYICHNFWHESLRGSFSNDYRSSKTIEMNSSFYGKPKKLTMHFLNRYCAF